MSFYYLTAISGYSIALAVIIGLVRFSRSDKSYHPFIIVCCIALLNEMLSHFLILSLGTNAVNANIYVWFEFVLLCWQFREWGSLRNKKWHYPALLIVLSLVWIIDNLVWNDLFHFNSLFRICYSFCVLFLAIDYFNRLIVSETGNLLRHSAFLICSGLIIFFSYKATIEVFYLLKLQFSNSFYDNVYFLHTLINVIVNLIYALAILWIPKKQKYTLPF